MKPFLFLPNRLSTFNLFILFLFSIGTRQVFSQTIVSNCTELNNAIILANSDVNVGTVFIKAGVTIDISLCNGLRKIFKSIHISGQTGNPARIHGNNKFRIFYAQNNNAGFTFRISNLNINNGNISTNTESGGCVFVENGINTILTNVNFSNCNANYGGAVFTSGGQLSVTQCSFTSNSAYQGAGGAIYHSSANAPLTVASSVFSLNVAESRLSDQNSYGGAIYALTSIRISSSTFSSNTAKGLSYAGYGGAIYNYVYSITIEKNSIFSRNEATSRILEGYGGAISTGVSVISSSTFSDNIARRSGGAIQTRTLSVSTSTFLRNSAFSQGGAVYVSNSESPSNITSCTFQENKVNAEFAYGGALSGIILSISSSTFRSNQLTSVSSTNGFARGGAVYASNKLTSLSSNFLNNFVFAEQSSKTYGGAVYCDNLFFSRNNNFENNYAYSSSYSAFGGAVFSNQINDSFSSYSNNQVKSPNLTEDKSYGGALYLQANLDLSFSIFKNNFVSVGGSASAVGGAIFQEAYYSSNYILKISSSIFTNNSLDSPIGNGGALYLRGNVIIFNSTFTSNHGKTNLDTKISPNTGVMEGGAIYAEYGIQVDRCAFVSNFVAGIENGNGGAISLQSGSSSISRSKFENNYALAFGVESTSRPYGGAIISNNILNINSCQFTKNQVQSLVSHSVGGAIAAIYSLYVTSSSFINNTVISNCITLCSLEKGGGGAIFFTYELLISQSAFLQNMHMSSGFNPSSIGGAVFGLLSSYYQAPIIIGSNFTNNVAQSNGGLASGGAIYIVGLSAALSINTTTFNSNSAKGAVANSGALSVYGGTLSMIFCTFTSNSAVGLTLAYGGAIDVSSNSFSSSIYRSSFIQNYAKTTASGVAKGGAIHFGYPSIYRNGDLYVSYASFASNSANGFSVSRGGSIHVNPYQYAYISHSSFSASSSISPSSVGGAIYLSYNSFISFCKGMTFSIPSINTKKAKNSNSLIKNDIDAAPSVTVKFCPKISLFMEPSASFSPILLCDSCDCSAYFNPCDPKASCAIANGLTTCTCPSAALGNGFVCGANNGLGCA